MITGDQKWHYLAVRNMPKLLHRIRLKHNDGRYCINCLHSFRAENKLKSHQGVCEDHDYCHVIREYLIRKFT